MPPRKKAATKAVAEEKPPLEPTPIADQLVEDLRSAEEADLTHFDEDDDPLTHAGAFLDEDDRKEDD